MRSIITIEEAQARLHELLDQLLPGEELIITRENEPVARLIREAQRSREPRKPGGAKDTILYMADDFDAPLEEFKEYME